MKITIEFETEEEKRLAVSMNQGEVSSPFVLVVTKFSMVGRILGVLIRYMHGD